MAVNKLHKIVKKYDMKISTSKTKAIGVCGKKHTKGQNRNRRQNYRTSIQF
jgi:hypothetical protein